MRFSKANVVSLVILLGLAGIIYFVIGKNTRSSSDFKTGSIKGYVVSKPEVDKIVAQNPALTSKSASELILENKLLLIIAKDLALDSSIYKKATLEELVSIYGSNAEENQVSLYLSAYNNRMKAAITAVLTPGISGKFIIAHFDQNIEIAGGDQNSAFVSMSEKEQKDLLARDRAYALKFIQDLKSKLDSGAITFDEAIERERSDKYLGSGKISTLTQSGNFDTATEYKNAAVKISLDPPALAVLQSTSLGKQTGILTQQIPLAEKNTKDKADGFYSIYLVEKRVTGISKYPTFDSLWNDYKTKYQYKGPQR